MLILARRLNEEIEITVPPSAGETRIRVAIVQAGRVQTRLGFDAPAEVRILRDDAKVDRLA